MQKGEIMNPNYIIKQTLKNGGFTPDNVKGRYIVATPNNEKVKPIKHFTSSLIRAYLRLANEQSLTIGTWVHNGKVYLDTIKGFEDLEEALGFARLSNQLAIYDRLENKEIIL